MSKNVSYVKQEPSSCKYETNYHLVFQPITQRIHVSTSILVILTRVNLWAAFHYYSTICRVDHNAFHAGDVLQCMIYWWNLPANTKKCSNKLSSLSSCLFFHTTKKDKRDTVWSGCINIAFRWVNRQNYTESFVLINSYIPFSCPSSWHWSPWAQCRLSFENRT